MCRIAFNGCTCFDDSFLFGSGCSGVSFNSIATFFPSTKAKNTAPTTSNNFFHHVSAPLFHLLPSLYMEVAGQTIERDDNTITLL